MEERLREAAQRYAERDWVGAMDALRDVESTESNHLELAYLLGLCHARLEQWDEALLYLEQVVTAGSDLMRIYQCRLALAYVYTVTARHRLAEYELGRLVESGLESAQVFAALGYAAWAQGRQEEALRRYARALELEPENATALNGMGYVLACEGRDGARALTYCRKAVDKKPDSPAYLDSLAWAYHMLGFADEARDLIRRALDLAPEETEIREHARVISSGEAPI
ncbi:MAG TPA: tetratricopeptide repeat protein [Rectinemataceae bacterium]|nr:tetratricopeptide repeat protein [Rectinemataceae bacterium]